MVQALIWQGGHQVQVQLGEVLAGGCDSIHSLRRAMTAPQKRQVRIIKALNADGRACDASRSEICELSRVRAGGMNLQADVEAICKGPTLLYALDKIAEAWGEDDVRQKNCINQAVGNMMQKQEYVYSLRTCSQPEDQSMGDYYCRTQVEGTSLWDYVYKHEVCNPVVTTLPVWLTIMNQEAVWVATAYRKLVQ